MEKMVEDWRPSTMGFIQCTVEENGKRESGSYNVAARGGLEYFSEDRQARLVKEVRLTCRIPTGRRLTTGGRISGGTGCWSLRYSTS